MRSAAYLEQVVRSVNPLDWEQDGDGFVRTCLAALGVFVPSPVARVIPAGGMMAGWEQLDATEAQVWAGRGYPVVAILEDHAAIVVPGREGETEPWIAQGGPGARARGPRSSAFGLCVPTYYGHD